MKDFIKKNGAFSTTVYVLLVDHFGDIVNEQTALMISQKFYDDDLSYQDMETEIYDFDDTYDRFLIKHGIEVDPFTELDFVKRVIDHKVIFKYDNLDGYAIEIVFDMVEKTYTHYQYYKGKVNLDYEVEKVTHDAITWFIEKHFGDLND